MTRALLIFPLVTILASSAKADLLVGSHDTNAILRYDQTTGAPLGALVTPGSGGLALPHGFGFGPDGNLYVTGHAGGVSSPSPVKRYNGATGAYINDFVPVGGGGLTFGEGLRWGPDGNLYVASWWTSEVIRYDGATGAFLSTFSAGLNGPTGLAFGPDGMLYVANDTVNNVVRFNPTTGASLGVFVAPGSGGLTSPWDMVFGPDSNLYVASPPTDSVLRYSGTTGTFIDAFVAPGSGGLDGPIGLAFGPDGHLYVVSAYSGEVLRYNGTTGAFMNVFVSNGSGGLSFPHYLAFTPPPTPPGVTITESGGSTSIAEGGATDTYTVVLNSAPTANVTITLNPGTHVSVAPASLTFTLTNWSTPQTVTVTAIDDALVEGPHTGTITHTAASIDTNYNGIAIASVTASIVDNDTAPPGPSPGSGAEGSYPGSNGNGPGPEGTYGSSGRARNRILLGPFVHRPGDHRVVNTAHRSEDQAATDNVERSIPAWSVALTVFFLLVTAFGVWRSR